MSLLRDIKHKNIGLDAAGHARLLDFGLGCTALARKNADWSFGHPPGTRGWAAPEIFVNSPYTYYCDLYSLGVLLFILCTGGVDALGDPPHGPPGPEEFSEFYRDHRELLACL